MESNLLALSFNNTPLGQRLAEENQVTLANAKFYWRIVVRIPLKTVDNFSVARIIFSKLFEIILRLYYSAEK